MPSFEVTLNGKTYDVDAPNEQAAAFAVGQGGAPAAPKPAPPPQPTTVPDQVRAGVAAGVKAAQPFGIDWAGIAGGVAGDTWDAVKKVGGDIADGYQMTKDRVAKPSPGILGAVKDNLAGLGNTGQTLIDAINIPAAAMGSVGDHLIAKPFGQAVGGALAAVDPQHFTGSEKDFEGAMNNALAVAMPAKKGVGILSGLEVHGPPAPNKFTGMVERFDRANVRPSLAAGDEGAARVAQVAAETPFIGAKTRANLNAPIADTAAESARLAGQYGETRGRQITGENIQTGVDRFANSRDVAPTSGTAPAQASSFAAKAGKLYDDAFGGLDAAMAGKTGPAETAQVFGFDGPQTVHIGGSQIKTPATSAALQEITNGGQSRSINSLITDPTVAKAANALTDANAARDMSFDDLRRVRTWVRTAQKNQDLRQSIGDANLGRLESSLTQDIYANADQLGSPKLAQQLRRADQYYAAGQQRIQTALQPFASAKSGESAYGRLMQSAGSANSADAAQALSVKRSLQPDEWGDIAANAVSELGKPTAGAARAGGDDPGFSVSTFATNWNKLSPRGRQIMFGSLGGGGKDASDLYSALDNLASVASDLKTVEKVANHSNTASAQRAVTLAAGIPAAVMTHTVAPAAAGAGALKLSGEMMTSPKIVRWVANMTQAAKGGPASYDMMSKSLQAAAVRDQSLQPLVAILLNDAGDLEKAQSVRANADGLPR